jgi:hypothetical protein
MRLAFDPDEPPAEPPPECVSPTIWRLTHRLHRTHQLAADQLCTCGDRFPCAARRLADRGFLEALGMARGKPRGDLLDADPVDGWVGWQPGATTAGE